MTFTELYDRYFSKVYNYVRYHVRLPAETDDVTGEVFESALHSFGTYDAARAPVQAVFVVPDDARPLELRFSGGFAGGGVRYVFE